MRGLDVVTKMRLAGYKPESVWIFDGLFEYSPPTCFEDLAMAQVHLDGESLASVDLRPLVGIPVFVNGSDVERTKELARMCIAAGASTVMASCGEKFAFWSKLTKKWVK
jgi:hypothetical protein